MHGVEQTTDNKSWGIGRSLIAFCLLAVVLAAAILSTYWFHFGGPLSSDQAQWANFGSFTGGTIGTVVSLSAFFALLVTIRIQIATLEVSQRELKSTSESAKTQANYFKSKELIDDILDSIRELETEINAKRNMNLVAYNNYTKQVAAIHLSHFLDRDTHLLAGLTPPEINVSAFTTTNCHMEFKALFQLLFDQIMALKEIPSTKNRYKVLMQKHLETFYYLTKIEAFDETNFSDLTLEDKSRIDQFKSQINVLSPIEGK